MKSIIVMSIFISTSVMAMTPFEVCDNIRNPKESKRCQRVLESSDNFDSNALKSCNRLTSDKLGVDCMEIISDHSFQLAALKVCDHITSEESQIECFSVIKNREFLESDLQECDQYMSGLKKTACLDKK